MKTFRDAIYIARPIGAHYIWIDSLYIIPNSYQDWLHESARMSDVYQYSSYNIFATSAVDDTIGCLFDLNRNLNLAFPLRLHFGREGDLRPASDGQVVESVESSSLDGCFELEVPGREIRNRGVTGSAINKRAWVLQEVSDILSCVYNV